MSELGIPKGREVPNDVKYCIEDERVFYALESKPVVYSSEEPRGSTTIQRLTSETGKRWLLEVDYQRPLEYHYYASGMMEARPPERDYYLQIDDWKHGYMWSRFHLAPGCGSEVRRTAPFDEYGHYFWVKYKARLYELVPDPSRAIVEVTLGETWAGKVTKALNKFKLGGAFQRMVVAKVAEDLREEGWKVVRYSVEDDKLILDVEKIGSPAVQLLPIVIIAGALIIFGLAIVAYAVINKETKKLILEAEGNRQTHWNQVYELCTSAGGTHNQCVIEANKSVEALKSQQEELSLMKTLRYGIYAIIGLVAISLISGIRR